MNRLVPKFGPTIFLLALALPFVSLVVPATALQAAESDASPSNRTRISDWESYERKFDLADDSQLFHYVSEVSSVLKSPGVTDDASTSEAAPIRGPKLRLSFIPRFNCAPIISVVFEQEAFDPAQHKDVLMALKEMEFSVDGTVISYPALTERADASLMAHYDTELRRRNTFRILVESGSTARVDLGLLGQQFEYSLRGSKRAISMSLGRCQSHTDG